MSIGSLGIVGGIAGGIASQAKGEAERVRDTADAHRRQVQAEAAAADAAGIGRADGENHETAERDADGRRLYEEPLGRRDEDPSETEAVVETDAAQAVDPSGESGSRLDLTG